MKTDLSYTHIVSLTEKMSSKYIPPAARNAAASAAGGAPPSEKPRYQPRRRDFKPQWEAEKEAAEHKKREDEEKNIQNTEDNFPSLGSSIRNTRTWASSGKSFADLAKDWDSHRQKEDELKALEKKRIEEYESRKRREYTTTLPQFNNIGRYVEPEDEEEDVQKPTPKEDNDGWILVDRKKVRKQKEVDVDDDNMSSSSSEKEDTVWNNDQPEEHETCWDEKRY